MLTLTLAVVILFSHPERIRDAKHGAKTLKICGQTASQGYRKSVVIRSGEESSTLPLRISLSPKP